MENLLGLIAVLVVVFAGGGVTKKHRVKPQKPRTPQEEAELKEKVFRYLEGR